MSSEPGGLGQVRVNVVVSKQLLVAILGDLSAGRKVTYGLTSACEWV